MEQDEALSLKPGACNEWVFEKHFILGVFLLLLCSPQSPLNSATRKDGCSVCRLPWGQTCLAAGWMQTAEGVFPGVKLSLCLCSGLLEKGIKDKSKLLSACLSLSPRYNYLSAERICLSLGSLFTSARGISSKCHSGVLVCNPPAASKCLV